MPEILRNIAGHRKAWHIGQGILDANHIQV